MGAVNGQDALDNAAVKQTLLLTRCNLPRAPGTTLECALTCTLLKSSSSRLVIGELELYLA